MGSLSEEPIGFKKNEVINCGTNCGKNLSGKDQPYTAVITCNLEIGDGMFWNFLWRNEFWIPMLDM